MIVISAVWTLTRTLSLSFWWHPFTAEGQLVSKWCNSVTPLILLFCSYNNNKKIIFILYIYIRMVIRDCEIASHLIYCDLGRPVTCKTLQHTPKTWTEVHVRITCANAYANNPGMQSLWNVNYSHIVMAMDMIPQECASHIGFLSFVLICSLHTSCACLSFRV